MKFRSESRLFTRDSRKSDRGSAPREVSDKFSRMGGELAAEVCKTITLSSRIRVLQLYVRAMSPL